MASTQVRVMSTEHVMDISAVPVNSLPSSADQVRRDVEMSETDRESDMPMFMVRFTRLYQSYVYINNYVKKMLLSS